MAYSKKQQAEANIFALELLIPRSMLPDEKTLKKMYFEENDYAMKKLAKKFAVSVTALKAKLAYMFILGEG